MGSAPLHTRPNKNRDNQDASPCLKLGA